MGKTDHTLVADLLTVMRVPHTEDYTRQRFETMPFQTLFGVTQLLKEYGVESSGYHLGNKEELGKLDTPYIAQTDGGLVIVTSVDNGNVSYLTQGVSEIISLPEFEDACTGIVVTVKATKGAKEPDYGQHRTLELISASKKVLLWLLAGVLTAYLIVENGMWRHPFYWGLLAVDCGGIWFTYMLVQKSLGIKNQVSDKVCGVLQEGGCDEILKTNASSFFGIFSWSEVGFTYFGVSLISMLIAPQTLHWLSIINICCLPFTVWSIWYQKFRARHWCTLCVSVQLSLWLQFICYLFGHWQAPIFPLRLGFFALGATFVLVLLFLNRVLPHFSESKSE